MPASTPGRPSSPRSTPGDRHVGPAGRAVGATAAIPWSIVGRERRRLVPRGRPRPGAVPGPARGHGRGARAHRLVQAPDRRAADRRRGRSRRERLRAAMRAGLEDQVDHLRSSSDSFSLPAWRKWSRLMTDSATPRRGRGSSPTATACSTRCCALLESVDGDVGAVGRAPARAVRGIARRGGRRAREPRARRCGAGLAQRRRPVGGARRRGGPTRPRRCRRRGRGRRALHEAVDGRRTGPRAGPRPRMPPPGRSAIATPTRSRCRRTGSRRSSTTSATRLGAIYEAEVDALEVTARAIGR